MASPPTWRCTLALSRAQWQLVSWLHDSCPLALYSPSHGWIGHKTHFFELHRGHRTRSRAMSLILSTCTNESVGEMIWGLLEPVPDVCACVYGLPCWTALSITGNNWCGFGKVTALRILQYLLPLVRFSCTVQNPVGYPSSTCYAADSLYRAPPGCYKRNVQL